MVEDGKLYDVLWTPDFTEDLFEAVAYITEELGSPMAAWALFDGVCELLDSQRAMPTSATTKAGKDGSTRYIVTYKNWDIYYIIEGDAIKVIGLKHHLQAGGRGVLPSEKR
ncbi:MAG: type II toxin-antitoxin system RelE/ParE family toxin [Eggerthellaceae bacterium]|nr:type II toxin-antitoxin system RelE/ParE family toxin [Eggerthellaceae bacterium]